ncbi:hypothetical protein [Rhodanobacter sp. B05]|nr:hypothetical protein [Rhodanobacter sp. B05]
MFDFIESIEDTLAEVNAELQRFARERDVAGQVAMVVAVVRVALVRS